MCLDAIGGCFKLCLECGAATCSGFAEGIKEVTGVDLSREALYLTSNFAFHTGLGFATKMQGATAPVFGLLNHGIARAVQVPTHWGTTKALTILKECNLPVINQIEEGVIENYAHMARYVVGSGVAIVVSQAVANIIYPGSVSASQAWITGLVGHTMAIGIDLCYLKSDRPNSSASGQSFKYRT
jgi:hypothetical protein